MSKEFNAVNVVEALEAMYASREDDWLGICYNLSYVFERFEAYRLVAIASQGWEHHTGYVDYPVSGHNLGNLWEGKQLELRISLINHLIARIESTSDFKLLYSKEERSKLRDK